MRNINKGKIKRAALLLLAALSFVSHACTSGQGPSSETEPAEVTVANPEELVAEVKITVDKEKIPSSGAEAIYITAVASDADGNVIDGVEFEYFAQGKPLESPVFFTNVPGFYNLYAYCNDIRSNVIEVQVFDSDVARVALYAAETTVAVGGRVNTVTNAYKSNGARSSRQGKVYVNGEELDGRVFSPAEPGMYVLHSVVQNVRSNPFVILATESTPPDAKLALGAAANHASIGQTVHFTATLADEQGRQITGKIEDCTLFKIENDYTTLTELKDGKFTPEAAGRYHFVAVCGGVASRTFTLSVTDPSAPTYIGEESDIPVIVIDTHGQQLSDRYTRVTMYVYDSGKTNKHTDKPTIVTEAEVRWRGQSSLGFPKKQFAVHTVTYNGSNNNLPLLGMPAENDWVLNGSYADKSLIRNGLAYYIFGLVCDYAPRARYCEVYVNSTDNPNNPLNYQGVYTLIEKIKPDENRVNIHKLTPEDNSGEALTGGYIVAIDKFKDGDYHWSTDFGEFVLVYPSNKNITSAQRQYITDYVMDFTRALHSEHFTDPETGYRKYLDVDSTVKHIAVTELLRDVDGFVFSTYFYKPRGGKLYAGPAWDYDLSLGNADYADGANPHGWYVTSMALSRHLLRDPYFHQRYIEIWQQLRQNILKDENLLKYIDEHVGMLGNALQRSLERWPEQWDGRTYVWPNLMGKNYRSTHEEEIAAMKRFIIERADWIDRHIENSSW
ncbi:MAG: CotH kinase family protein [Eubacteriales bacterium]|jgi:hypothetical protein|nr:hypothetical protein [Clostridiales bacterium]